MFVIKSPNLPNNGDAAFIFSNAHPGYNESFEHHDTASTDQIGSLLNQTDLRIIRMYCEKLCH